MPSRINDIMLQDTEIECLFFQAIWMNLHFYNKPLFFTKRTKTFNFWRTM